MFLHLDIMPGSDIAAAEPVGPLLKQSELHERIAIYTRVRCISIEVAVNKRAYYGFLEIFPHIGYMMRNAQPGCKKCCRFGCLKRSCTCNKCQALDTIALFKQHAAHGSTVNTAAHTYQHTLFRIHHQYAFTVLQNLPKKT